MSRTSSHHETLDESGEGKCSVPMFGCGGPSGFCDRPAYGNPLPYKRIQRRDGTEFSEDGRYTGYVPALACPIHGGPETRVFKDGNMFCAVYPDWRGVRRRCKPW